MVIFLNGGTDYAEKKMVLKGQDLSQERLIGWLFKGYNNFSLPLDQRV